MGQCHPYLVPLKGPPNFSFTEIPAMSAVVTFYSIHEEVKPADQRVYHNNTDCPIAQAIPDDWRNTGTNGYSLCLICSDLIERIPLGAVV